MNYKQYISSNAWRRGAARLAALAAAGNRCSLCPSEGSPENPIEVHHRTYERLGEERPEDLTALCRSCHHEVTNFQRARTYAVRVPKRADVVELRDPRALPCDPTRGASR